MGFGCSEMPTVIWLAFCFTSSTIAITIFRLFRLLLSNCVVRSTRDYSSSSP